MTEVYVVMVDGGNAEGGRSWPYPARVFESLIEAKAYAQGRRERPEDAAFWIPPASVEVVTTYLQQARAEGT